MQRHTFTEPEDWPRSEVAHLSPAFTDETARRAAFILAMTKELEFLGLNNMHEPEALLIAPLHCFPENELDRVISAVGHGMDRQALAATGLDVLCPALVRYYAGPRGTEAGARQSNASLADTLAPSSVGAVLFDPLYGTAVVRENERTRHLCFTDHLWVKLALSQPPAQREAMQADRAGAFREGAVVARQTLAPLLADGTEGGTALNTPIELVIQTPHELERVLGGLDTVVNQQAPGMRVWLRGQTRDYLVPDRSALVARGLFPYSAIRDSSLVPGLYRSVDQYIRELRGYMRLARHFSHWAQMAHRVLPSSASILDSQGNGPYTPKPAPMTANARSHLYRGGKPHLPIPGLRDMGPYTHTEIFDDSGQVVDSYITLHHLALQSMRQMLLLQHYGCPTPWLDITSDPTMALWFAMNKLVRVSDGQYRAERVRYDSTNPADWPTIYVFLLHPDFHPVVETASILRNSSFLRPQRQCCGLLGGAGNLARNYAARYIGMKLRLAPAFAEVALPSAAYVFPPADEDEGLRALLAEEGQPMPDQEKLFPVYHVAST